MLVYEAILFLFARIGLCGVIGEQVMPFARCLVIVESLIMSRRKPRRRPMHLLIQAARDTPLSTRHPTACTPDFIAQAGHERGGVPQAPAPVAQVQSPVGVGV